MNINKTNPAPAPVAPRRAAAPAQAKGAAPAAPKDAFKGSPDQYVIRPGDTLAKIAARFSVSQQTLLELNPELTRGRKRTSTGDRIFAGETIRLKPAPSEADGLRDRLKQQEEVSNAKVNLFTMPDAKSWKSLGEAKKHLAAADKHLAKVPADDPDRATCEGIVKGAHAAFEGMTNRLTDLAARNKTKVVKETGEDGKPVERTEKRELDDETLGLATPDIALATPQQKAKLIRNLYDGFTGGDEQDKILGILQDAKQQGQLDDTLAALKEEKTETLFVFKSTVFERLPSVFTDSRLDKLEQIVKGNAELEAAINRTREQRERQHGGR